MSVSTNPQGVEDEYLRCLNLCFGNWGDERKYHWYFRRKTAYPDTDLMILKVDGQLAAGSAVSYRQVALRNDREISVGIMTGSWTLPQFRGRGCFTRIIEESVRLTAGNGGALLLAFVREENASFRRLARAGAALFPAFYLNSTPQTQPPAVASKLGRLKQSERIIETMFASLKKSREGCSHFSYSTERDFCSQFVHRPCETEILGDGRGNFGIVEKNEDTDVLQLCLAGDDDERGVTYFLAGLLRRALQQRRRLFLYSTRPAVRRAGTKLGLDAKVGYLTALVADESRLQGALGTPVRQATGSSSALAQTDSQWFLGTWEVQSGDRV